MVISEEEEVTDRDRGMSMLSLDRLIVCFKYRTCLNYNLTAVQVEFISIKVLGKLIELCLQRICLPPTPQ